MNLGLMADYSGQWSFVDAFKMSRPWISQQDGADWGAGGPLALTPEGWVAALTPGQYATTVMMDGYGPHYPGGDYVLLYDGEGKIRLEYDTAQLVSEEPGRMVVNVTPNDGVFLSVVETNPANPLRNIRFIMPGFESAYQTQPFHPTFLDRLRPFHVLRFLDWMVINDSPLKEWAERTRLDSATQVSDYGAAPEYIVELANTLNVHPWIQIPHQASDDYVRQLATLVCEQLNSALNIYIEYSNETWNPIFGQTQYVQEQGLALNLASDPYSAGLRFYSQRAVEIFNLWEEVFGGRERLVRVLAGQTGPADLNVEIMDWQAAFKSADAFAVGAYFGYELGIPEAANTTAAMTVDELIAVLEALLRDTAPNSLAWSIAQDAAAARERGLPLVAYEGGQHLWGIGEAANNEALTTLFTTVNRDARMKSIYLELLAMWRRQGGGLFLHLSDVSPYNRYGSWGALEFQDQDPATAPKYQALLEFMAQLQNTSHNAPTLGAG